MFEKDMHVTLLTDYYGDLLNEHKRNLVELYYNEDYSLAEIAEISGLTRQGVRDSIKKSVAELYDIDKKLKLLSRTSTLKSEISRIVSELDDALSIDDTHKTELLLKIKDELKNITF